MICDEKPFWAVADSDVDPELPPETETEVGFTAKEKSGVDGGGGFCEPPPPQPSNEQMHRAKRIPLHTWCAYRGRDAEAIDEDSGFAQRKSGLIIRTGSRGVNPPY